ncbi:MAG: hypothetical protein ACP5C4_08915 [Methanomicrobiales archaeon]
MEFDSTNMDTIDREILLLAEDSGVIGRGSGDHRFFQGRIVFAYLGADGGPSCCIGRGTDDTPKLRCGPGKIRKHLQADRS